MLYPAFVELGNDNTAYGVELPDFPGCFSASDNEADLVKNMQEAIELYFDGEDLALPEPSSIAEVSQREEYQRAGVWMLFEVDTAKFSTKSKRINITMPENLLAEIDSVASNRSAFLVDAAREKLK